MEIGIIAFVLAVLGFVGFRIAGDGATRAGAGLLSAILGWGGESASLTEEWLLDKYEEHVIPWLTRVAWATFWVMMMVAAGIWTLCIPERSLAPISAITVISIAAGVGGLILVFTVLRKSAFESSSFRLISVPVLATWFVGITAISSGAFGHSRALILIGAVALLFACQLFAWIVEFAAEIGEEGTEAMRRISDNWVFRKAAAFSKKLERASENVYRRLVSWIAPVVIPLILFPSPITFGIWATIGIASHIAWTNLEDKGEDTASRYKGTALTLELLSYMLIPLLPYVLLVPDGAERVSDFTDWLFAVASGKHVLGWKAVMAWVLIGAAAGKHIYPWGEKQKAETLRKVVAIPLALMGVICLLNFGLRFLPKKASAASSAQTASAASPLTPSNVTATGTPAVVPSASSMPTASGSSSLSKTDALVGGAGKNPVLPEFSNADEQKALGEVLAECARLGVPCE